MTTEKGGVPLTYTKELGEEICLKISTSDGGLGKLCKENPHWPCRQTIFEWRIKVKEFGDSYAKAKQEQIEVLVDECLDIADDVSRDTTIRIDDEGNEKEICNSEWINRSRLRIDTRKWVAAKLAPKIYGDNTKNNEPEKNDDELNKDRELTQKCIKPIP